MTSLLFADPWSLGARALRRDAPWIYEIGARWCRYQGIGLHTVEIVSERPALDVLQALATCLRNLMLELRDPGPAMDWARLLDG